jgi:general nucleoside transport system permease protein
MTTAVITDTPRELPSWLPGLGRWVVAILGALVIFAAFMWADGATPIDAYRSMWTSITTGNSISAILVKGSPLILAALAVTVPARAGLVNVGGEGQLIMGGVFGAWASMHLGGHLGGGLTLLLMCVFAALGGALWAGIAGALRLWVGINEAVTTLLLNYVALNFMLFLIYDPWKDASAGGQPTSAPIPAAERLPLLAGSKVHAGILLALVATFAVWWALRSTRWGFQLQVVGGNREAARRAGMKVGVVLLSAMLVGGALAGLGGLTQLAGAEFKLRPGFLASYGYIGFLASWLARHKPIQVALAALALSAISISGDSLQIDSQLPAATVNILMALVLLAVFGFTRRKATT